MYASVLAGDGYFDDIGCEHRQSEPPRRRQAAGSRAMSVSPHRGANPCRVRELAIVHEEHTGRAANPAARSNPSINRVRAQPGGLGLGKGNDAVIVAELVVEKPGHVGYDDRPAPIGSLPVIRGNNS
jgi:hypothetical protein